MADEAFAEMGGVDVLVNNVGDVARDQMSCRDIDEESIDHVIDVDVKGTLFCIHEFGSRMLDQGHGSIVNIGSTVIVRGSAREQLAVRRSEVRPPRPHEVVRSGVGPHRAGQHFRTRVHRNRGNPRPAGLAVGSGARASTEIDDADGAHSGSG